MRRKAFGVVFVFSLLLFFSGNQISPAFANGMKLVDTSNATTDSILNQWLNGQMMSNQMPHPRKLFVWLDETELDSIEQEGLLIRSFQSVLPLTKIYTDNLFSSKFMKDQYARLLRSSDKLNKREAWPSLFGDQLGDQVVEVELREDAWYIQFKPDEIPAFIGYDLEGNVISLPELQKNPERIAAVYFFKKINTRRDIGARRKDILFKNWYGRNIYLVNEKMIKHWHHATPGLQEALLKQINYCLLLDAYLNSTQGELENTGWKSSDQLKIWADPSDRTITEKFIAYQNYMIRKMEPGEFDRILRNQIDMLRACWPLQKNPIEKFPGME